MSARTLSTKAMRRLPVVADDESGPLPVRPATRGECVGGSRPCPWVGCRHNAYLEVNPKTGSMTMNFPHLAPEDMDPKRSCVLDIADGGEVTLEEAGDVLNLTRERSRQIEFNALARIHGKAFMDASVASVLVEHAIDPNPNSLPLAGQARRRIEITQEPGVEADDPEFAESEQTSEVSFFSGDDEAVCDSVWSMLSRLWGIRSKSSLAISAYRRRMAMSKGDR